MAAKPRFRTIKPSGQQRPQIGGIEKKPDRRAGLDQASRWRVSLATFRPKRRPARPQAAIDFTRAARRDTFREALFL